MINKNPFLKKSFYIIVNIVILICVISYINNSDYLGVSAKIKILSIYCTINFMYSIYYYYISYKTLVDIFILFYIASFMFNGSKMILIAFNITIDNDFLFNHASENEVLVAFIFVTISLNVLYNLFILLNRQSSTLENRFSNSKDIIVKEKSLKALKYTGCILYVISFIPMMLSLKNQINIVSMGGYFAQYQQDIVTGFQGGSAILSNFFIPANLFLYAGSIDNKKLRRFTVITILFISVVKILLGNRSSGIICILVLVFLRNRIYKPIKGKVIVAIFVILFFVVSPIISEVRDYSSVDEKKAAVSLFKSKNENLVVKAIDEMGGSIITVAYTFRLVPSYNEYKYGVTYLRAFSAIIPNLFWDIHPAVAELTPSQWLIWSVDPSVASAGGGLGYSYIAEAYLNFGYYGLIIIPFFLALMLTIIKRLEKKGEIGSIVTIAIYLSYIVLIVRNDSMYMFRSMVWFCIFPYFIYWLFSKKNSTDKLSIIKS